MTNADCIRHMSDEQLYEFLSEWECGDIDYSVTFCDLCNEATKRGEIGNVLNLDCDGCRKHWLQRDAVDYGGLMYWKKNTTFDTNAERKTENNSEKPNNCEHITEDGVTCAKYPACDGCLDNPLNKVKGSERLVKGSEQTKSTISKMEQVEDEPQTDCGDFADRLAYERGVKHAWEVAQKVFNSTVTFYEAEDFAKQIDKDINVRSKDEPQTENLFTDKYGDVWEWRGDAWYCISGDEPQTETEIAKAIVHKMIDDAVIAEDAYPDLRQKMHDAVDEYEPQTDCAWK